MILPQKKRRKRNEIGTQRGRKGQQLDFFGKSPTSHGGSLNLGKRKKYRPMDIKRPLHVILKSYKARGKLALPNHDRKLIRILTKMANKFAITISERNINWDHIHLLVRGKRRENLQNFFRAIASLIAREVTGATKGKPFGRFWSYLVFSRIVNGKRDFENVRSYIVQNTLETLGLVPYKKRNTS